MTLLDTCSNLQSGRGESSQIFKFTEKNVIFAIEHMNGFHFYYCTRKSDKNKWNIVGAKQYPAE